MSEVRSRIARDRSTVLLEVNDPLHKAGHGSAVKEFIDGIGYRISVFEDGCITLLQNGDVWVNYVLQAACASAACVLESH